MACVDKIVYGDLTIDIRHYPESHQLCQTSVFTALNTNGDNVLDINDVTQCGNDSECKRKVLRDGLVNAFISAGLAKEFHRGSLTAFFDAYSQVRTAHETLKLGTKNLCGFSFNFDTWARDVLPRKSFFASLQDMQDTVRLTIAPHIATHSPHNPTTKRDTYTENDIPSLLLEGYRTMVSRYDGIVKGLSLGMLAYASCFSNGAMLQCEGNGCEPEEPIVVKVRDWRYFKVN